MRRWRHLRFALFTLAVLPCAAQNTDEVHVTPRTKPQAQQPVKPPAGADPSLKTYSKPFVSNVDVVLVPVTVMDTATRIVTGLQQSNFQVLEDGKPQKIEYFYTQDAPLSLGIIFDQSGSMGQAVNTSRDAIKEFMKASNPDDEFFLIMFSDKPQLMGDFTNSPEDIDGKLVYTVPRGLTALWDAVYLGLSKMKTAKYPKRVLMIFSDGGENHSRYSGKELLRVVREADVQIYGVAIPGADYGPGGMEAVSNASGGRAFLGPPNTFPDTAAKVALELRNQYVLGYRSTNRAHNGTFRKIRVKLVPPPGLPPLVVSSKKTGYYAPED